MRSIQSFNDLSAKFLAQFAANRAKKFMVDDMHDLKQRPNETFKEYLARFNAATVHVVDSDKKMFVFAFMKRVRSGPFNESLNQRRPTSLDEIRARAECYIDGEEANALKKKSENRAQQNPRRDNRHYDSSSREGVSKLRGFTGPQIRKREWSGPQSQGEILLNAKKFDILREVLHTKLFTFPPPQPDRVIGPNRDRWCNFHRAYDHETKECWTLQRQIERLIREGHLG